MRKFRLIDLTWSEKKRKPAPVLEGFEPGYWATSNFTDGSRHLFDAQRYEEYVRAVAGEGAILNGRPFRREQEQQGPMPAGFTSRLACVDLELAPAGDDRDAMVLGVIRNLRRRMPASQRFMVFGHALGAPSTHDRPPPDPAPVHVDFARPGWDDPRVRQWIPQRLDRQRELVNACACAWADGYVSQPNNRALPHCADWQLEGLSRQIEMIGAAYPATELLVIVSGTYALSRFGQLDDATLDKLAARVSFADGAILIGEYENSEKLAARLRGL